VPVQIPALEGESIIQLECGTQFSVALSKNGRVYTWGRGEYFRLGTDSSAPIYQPHRLLSLTKVKVVQISVGGLHCIALTDSGEVSSILFVFFFYICLMLRLKECQVYIIIL